MQEKLYIKLVARERDGLYSLLNLRRDCVTFPFFPSLGSVASLRKTKMIRYQSSPRCGSRARARSTGVCTGYGRLVQTKTKPGRLGTAVGPQTTAEPGHCLLTAPAYGHKHWILSFLRLACLTPSGETVDSCRPKTWTLLQLPRSVDDALHCFRSDFSRPSAAKKAFQLLELPCASGTHDQIEPCQSLAVGRKSWR